MSLTEKIKDKLDKNGDGIVSGKEVVSALKDSPSLLLYLILAIIGGAGWDYIKEGLFSGDWSDGVLSIVLSVVIGPLIMMYAFNKYIKGKDKEISELEDKNSELKEEKMTMEFSQKDILSELRIENKQLEGAVFSKKEFIDTLWSFIPTDIREKLNKVD